MTSPTITGTIPNQITVNNIPIHPFTGVVVDDANGGAPTDTVTIILSSPAFGVLSGIGVDPLIPGTYQIVGTDTEVTNDLQAATFTPAAATAPSAVTTGLRLTVESTGAPGDVVDAAPLTTVTDFVGPVAPTITGTIAGQRTTHNNLWAPFSGVTVADSNAGTSDTMFIALSSGGTTGALSGPGLAGGTSGLYFLIGYTAEQITTQLDGLVFTPTPGAPGGVTPTTFTLSDFSTALRSATDDNTTLSNTIPTDSILFQNTNGQASIWQLNGTNIIGGGAATVDGAAVNPGTSWTAIGTAAFFGSDPSDILWQNSDGQASIWQMNGTNVIGGGPTTLDDVAVNPGMSWKAVGTGQFSDGIDSDILWQNTDGQVAIWNMNGNAITGSGLANVGDVPINPGTDWKAIGSGDFFNRGYSGDILLQNTSTGQVSIWEMSGNGNGATVVGGGQATVGGVTVNPGTDWKAIGTGNFTADGPDDIIFQNSTTSQVAIWDMDGTSIIGSGIATVDGVAATPGLEWKAIGSDSGGSDILFQNTMSGQTATWAMGGAEGTTIVGGGPTSINAGPTWAAVGLTASSAA